MSSHLQLRSESLTANLTDYSPQHIGGEWTTIVLDPPNGDQTQRFCLGPTEASIRRGLDALLDRHPIRTSSEERLELLTKLMEQLSCLRARGERLIVSAATRSEDG